MTESWERIADMKFPRSMAAAATTNGKLYICGGSSHGKWEPPQPEPIFMSMFGGGSPSSDWTEEGSLDSCERFDPESSSWEELAPMSIPRARFSLVLANV